MKPTKPAPTNLKVRKGPTAADLSSDKGEPASLKKGLPAPDVEMTITVSDPVDPTDLQKALDLSGTVSMKGQPLTPLTLMQGAAAWSGLPPPVESMFQKPLAEFAKSKGLDPAKVQVIDHVALDPSSLKKSVHVFGYGAKTIAISSNFASPPLIFDELKKALTEIVELKKAGTVGVSVGLPAPGIPMMVSVVSPLAADALAKVKHGFQKAISGAFAAKAEPTLVIPAEADEDDEGMFTSTGIAALTAYSNAWLQGNRSLELEREHPALTGPFYDIRSDPDYARRWADDVSLSKAWPSFESLKKGLAGDAISEGTVVVDNEGFHKALEGATFDEKHIGAWKDGQLEHALQKSGLTKKPKKKPEGFQKATFVIDDKG